VCIALSGIGGFWIWMKRSYYLPPDQKALSQFEVHRADYIHFAELIRNDSSARYIYTDGGVDIGGVKRRVVPEYRRLIHAIGAQFVIVGEDGSVEFALWGDGCAICSDSYMGVLYDPKGDAAARPAWQQMRVASLASSRLPQENGSVATGLYVLAIEPNWFIYRFEYQE